MRIQFLAVEISSNGYTSIATIETEQEFYDAMSDFEGSVSYHRWYPDHQFESGTPEEEALFEEWLEKYS